MTFTATHVIPAAGLPTWPAPDPSGPRGPALDGGLDVQVLQTTPEGWAQVLCSNGWTAWVDARALTVLASPATPAHAAAARRGSDGSSSKTNATKVLMAVFGVVVLGAGWAFRLARGSMSPDTAKTMSVVGIVVMAGMLVMSLRGVKLPARVRTPFELGRALCSLGAVVAVGAGSRAGTPQGTLVAGVALGVFGGLLEGSNMLVVLGSDGRRYSRRAVVPMVVSSLGLIVAAWAARSGSFNAMRMGQFVGMVGVGLMIGVPVGRIVNRDGGTRPPALAGHMGAILLAVFAAPLVLLLVGGQPALAAGDYDGTYDGRVESGLEGNPTLDEVSFSVTDGEITGSFQMAAKGRLDSDYSCTALSGEIESGDVSGSEDGGALRASGTVLVFVTGTFYSSRAELDADPCTTPASASNGESYEADIEISITAEGLLVADIEGDGPLGSYRLAGNRTSGGSSGGGSTGGGSTGGGSTGGGSTGGGSTGGSTGSGSTGGSTSSPTDKRTVTPNEAAAAAAGTIAALGAAGILSAAEAAAAQGALERGEVPADVIAALQPTVSGRGGPDLAGPWGTATAVPQPPPDPLASPPSEDTLDDLLHPMHDVPDQLAMPPDPLAAEPDLLDSPDALAPADPLADEPDLLDSPDALAPADPLADEPDLLDGDALGGSKPQDVTDGEIGAILDAGDKAIDAHDGSAGPKPKGVTDGEIGAILDAGDKAIDAHDGSAEPKPSRNLTDEEMQTVTEVISDAGSASAQADADRVRRQKEAEIYQAVIQHDADVAAAEEAKEASGEAVDDAQSTVRQSMGDWGDKLAKDAAGDLAQEGQITKDIDTASGKVGRSVENWAQDLAQDGGPALEDAATKTGRDMQQWADGLAGKDAPPPATKPLEPGTVRFDAHGTVQVRHEGGAETRLDGEGAIHVTEPDGTSQTQYPDGRIENRDATGRVTSTSTGPTFDPADVRADVVADAPVERVHTDGSVTRLDEDGAIHLVEPDGSQQVQHPDGRIQNLDAKGTVVSETDGAAFDPDEVRGEIANAPAPVEQVHGGGRITRIDSDGVIHHVDVMQGSHQMQHPDGRIENVDGSGKVISRSEGPEFDPDEVRAEMQQQKAASALPPEPTDPESA